MTAHKRVWQDVVVNGMANLPSNEWLDQNAPVEWPNDDAAVRVFNRKKRRVEGEGP